MQVSCELTYFSFLLFYFDFQCEVW